MVTEPNLGRTVIAVALVVAAFVVMEPLTYLNHRFVMHGIGMVWHRSHHLRWSKPRTDGESFFEANDWFPVVFSGLSMIAIALGFNVNGLGALLPITAGVTLYGLAYAFVHDVYIHQRLVWSGRTRILNRLAVAHALHHRYGGEPYGMLVPIVPAELRARDAASRLRSAERVDATPGS